MCEPAEEGGKGKNETNGSVECSTAITAAAAAAAQRQQRDE